MESQSPCVLVLCGKSSTEKELAKSMEKNSILKLPENAEVSVFLHLEKEKSFDEESLCINSYMNSLSTVRFGRFLIWSPQLPSTHDVVSNNFGDLPIPIGAVCVADFLYKRRGGLKNVWESPKGCLLLSFTMQMEDGRVVPLVQYVVSLAMTEAIKDVCDRNGVPHLDVRIKWPNDLYLNGLKVGGILCTSTYRPKKFNVSAGWTIVAGCAAVARAATAGECLNREKILLPPSSINLSLFNLFMNQGFQPLEELYYKTWLHGGQGVTVEEKKEDQDQPLLNEVTIQGLTSSFIGYWGRWSSV